MKGVAKWFNARKGYGFITGEDNNEYFVHHTSIQMDGFKTLNEGQEVTFDTKKEEKGVAAINVVPVEVGA